MSYGDSFSIIFFYRSFLSLLSPVTNHNPAHTSIKVKEPTATFAILDTRCYHDVTFFQFQFYRYSIRLTITCY